MPDFRPATETETKALRALRITQQLQRRVEVRQAIHRAQVRLARTLEPLRPMQRVSDLLWHAQMAEHKARALHALARLARRSKVFRDELQRQRQRLAKGGQP